MTRPTHRLAAWITLAALFFSAASPTLAAALFAGRPEISARILGLPAPAPAKSQLCGEEGAAAVAPASGKLEARAAHGNHGAGIGGGGAENDEGEHDHHAAHGVFCSFCLVASSLLALPSCALAHAVPASVHVQALEQRVSFITSTRVGHPARGPPTTP